MNHARVAGVGPSTPTKSVENALNRQQTLLEHELQHDMLKRPSLGLGFRVEGLDLDPGLSKPQVSAV